MKFSEEKLALIAITFVFCVGSLLIYFEDRWELFPTFLLTCLTAIFSFLAYRHSKEKFRLDLFDRRYEIYEKTLEFSTCVAVEGNLNSYAEDRTNFENALKAAHNSFRGIGWHKTKALFAEDIEGLFEKLNKSFAYLVSHSQPPSNSEQYQEWVKNHHDHVLFVIKLSSELPDLFKAYIYFGNYKNE